MKLHRTAVAVVAMLALGCGGGDAPAPGDAAALAAAPDAQLAMATEAGMSHRPQEAGPITVYKSPT